MSYRRALPSLLLACCIAGSVGAQDDDITVYRCTDAGGRLTLQDAPCAKDQSQQTRRMLQLQDPPPRATPVAPVATQPPPQPRPERIIVQREPRPMYECVRPDGSRYSSDDGEGNPRWVASAGGWPYDAAPLPAPGIVHERATATTTGVVAMSTAGGGARRDPGGNGAPQLRFRNVPRDDTPSRPPPRPGGGHGGHGHGHGGGFGYGYGYGTWIRDDCSVLPRTETCSRLRDRREEIRRRFFNAQETERATLGTEERGINARLSEDCGGA
jgi:hypothetical protein